MPKIRVSLPLEISLEELLAQRQHFGKGAISSINFSYDQLVLHTLSESYSIGPQGQYKRIYHYHIRKTAGRFVHYSFFNLDKDFENPGDLYRALSEASNAGHGLLNGTKLFLGWNVQALERGLYYYGFSHEPMHKIKIPPATFTLTVLRDPVERFLSHYKMLIQFKEENIDHPCMQTEGPWLGNSIYDFIERIPKEHALNQIYMFSENFSVDEAYRNITGLSHYMFQSDLQTGMKQLGQKLGINFEDVGLVGAGSKKKLHLPDDALQKLHKLLEPEYELLERLRNNSTEHRSYLTCTDQQEKMQLL
ncbi:MAG: hypothetical protein D6719_05290 [Candidatus Dadabacteria bacterium]|nr:MAG: hypothetical protein D6719_05290 [Candidatus Dadabacteria bacterium]